MSIRLSIRPLLSLAILPLIAAAIAPTAEAAPAPRRPASARDSFLYPPANSTAELVRAVERDRVLRLRYAKHFHVTEDQMVNFIRRALIVYRLPEARTVTTYGVTRTGRIYPVRERMKKGTRVWATHSGTPILKWACANPLTTRLPGTKMAKGPRTSRPETPETAPVPETDLLVSATDNALPTADTLSLAPLATAVPPLPAPALASLLPLAGGGTAAVAVPALVGGGGSPWALLSSLLALFLPRGGGGTEEEPVWATVPPEFFGPVLPTPPVGGGGFPAVPPPVDGGSPLPPITTSVVPETGTVPLLAVGASALLPVLRRARKRREGSILR